MDDFGLIEYGYQTLHRSRRVPRSRLYIFPENAPGVLNGPYQNLLVGIIHSGNPRVTEVRNWPPTATELHRLPLGECPASSLRAPRIPRRAVAAPECREPAGRNPGR